MEEVTHEFIESETEISHFATSSTLQNIESEMSAPKKRAGRTKKTQTIACNSEEQIDISGSTPPLYKLRELEKTRGSKRGATIRSEIDIVTETSKKKSRKKKQINNQILEDMFDFNTGAVAATETTDDEVYNRGGRGVGKGRGGRGGGGAAARSNIATPTAVSFAATPACHLSKKERTEIERKFSKPKNECQKKYMSLLNDPIKKIVIATGPAGTGKTLLATEYAVRNLIFGEYEKLIFTRPSVSVDEDLGYLPGTLEEKMAPWMRPLYDILYEHFTVRETTTMVEEKVIEICPLGFMRGRTFKRCCIICDEMQNSTPAQMKMLLTRIGEGSRLIVTGDLDQCDNIERCGGYSMAFRKATQASSSKFCGVEDVENITSRAAPQNLEKKNYNEYCYNGLDDFLRRFNKRVSNSITCVEFKKEDIEREEVVKEILDIYEL